MVTLHVPLTPETRYMVRRETLELMKPGAILVNVSRGQLIDTTALIGALKSRHLGGVALDVYEEEEGVFFEDLSGRVLEDDVLARLLTLPERARHGAPGVLDPRGPERHRRHHGGERPTARRR